MTYWYISYRARLNSIYASSEGLLYGEAIDKHPVIWLEEQKDPTGYRHIVLVSMSQITKEDYDGFAGKSIVLTE